MSSRASTPSDSASDSDNNPNIPNHFKRPLSLYAQRCACREVTHQIVKHQIRSHLNPEYNMHKSQTAINGLKKQFSIEEENAILCSLSGFTGGQSLPARQTSSLDSNIVTKKTPAEVEESQSVEFIEESQIMECGEGMSGSEVHF